MHFFTSRTFFKWFYFFNCVGVVFALSFVFVDIGKSAFSPTKNTRSFVSVNNF